MYLKSVLEWFRVCSHDCPDDGCLKLYFRSILERFGVCDEFYWGYIKRSFRGGKLYLVSILERISMYCYDCGNAGSPILKLWKWHDMEWLSMCFFFGRRSIAWRGI